MSSLDK
jgi:hypothetical protein